MDPVSPLPAIASVFVALATASLLFKRFGAPPDQGRFASIDGLRGYLAFFVFLHHSCLWYFYLRTGQWDASHSHLYTHFGPSSVALFFMITGFLFFSKLIEGRTRPIDWAKLYVARFLRLAPLYFLLMFCLFAVVADLSHGILHESNRRLITEIADWLTFTTFGMPDINGIEHTWTIVAGVTWSLSYEWFFYLSLPLLALAIGIVAPFRYIILAIASMVVLAIWHPPVHHLIQNARSFLGGIAAALLVRSHVFRQVAARKIASVIILACVFLTVAVFPTPYGIGQFLLLSAAFALIASGNSLFGILINPISRLLGEMAYSIYLLHGLVLYLTFTFVIGVGEAKLISPLNHWLVVMGITPILIFLCFLTFRFVERPAMQSSGKCTAWLRLQLTLGRNPGEASVEP